MRVEIRPYKSEDLESVIHCWEAASLVGHPFLSDEFLASERKNIPSKYLPNGEAWVPLFENNVIGFMILHGNEVGALFVNPDYHGKGAGYALMNKASDLHHELKVEVFKDNAIGNKFYLRFGFKFVGEYFHEQSGMMMFCLEYKRDS